MLHFTKVNSRMRRIKDDQAFDPARIGRGEHPGEIAAPVIADQDASLVPEVFQQSMNIAQQLRHAHASTASG